MEEAVRRCALGHALSRCRASAAQHALRAAVPDDPAAAYTATPVGCVCELSICTLGGTRASRARREVLRRRPFFNTRGPGARTNRWRLYVLPYCDTTYATLHTAYCIAPSCQYQYIYIIIMVLIWFNGVSVKIVNYIIYNIIKLLYNKQDGVLCAVCIVCMVYLYYSTETLSLMSKLTCHVPHNQTHTATATGHGSINPSPSTGHWH